MGLVLWWINTHYYYVVADVLKTLSGETQLEFLMKKFMMDEEDEKVYSKRSTHAHEGNIAFVKRQTLVIVADLYYYIIGRSGNCVQCS